MANPKGINQYTYTGKTSRSAAKRLNKARMANKEHNVGKQQEIINRMKAKR